MRKGISSTLLVFVFSSCLVLLSGCSSECSRIKNSAAKTYSDAEAEFDHAWKIFEMARPATEYGSGQRLVPDKQVNGQDSFVITDKPILDEYYEIRRTWLTITVNNPQCFDARAVAEAEIELQNY